MAYPGLVTGFHLYVVRWHSRMVICGISRIGNGISLIYGNMARKDGYTCISRIGNGNVWHGIEIHGENVFQYLLAAV